jgi:hypothetical protein
MRNIARFALLVVSALVAAGGEARAQDSSTYVETRAAHGQSVVFEDDPLTADTEQAIGAQLTGFHPPRRFELIRPRSSFVTEMLKSVEAL